MASSRVPVDVIGNIHPSRHCGDRHRRRRVTEQDLRPAGHRQRQVRLVRLARASPPKDPAITRHTPIARGARPGRSSSMK